MLEFTVAEEIAEVWCSFVADDETARTDLSVVDVNVSKGFRQWRIGNVSIPGTSDNRR